MELVKVGIAGTLESSDVQVTIDPAVEDLHIHIESTVLNQYGRQIKSTVEQVLATLQVTAGEVTVIDKGALDCTIKARVACAVFRSANKSEKDIPWEVLA